MSGSKSWAKSWPSVRPPSWPPRCLSTASGSLPETRASPGSIGLPASASKTASLLSTSLPRAIAFRPTRRLAASSREGPAVPYPHGAARSGKIGVSKHTSKKIASKYARLRAHKDAFAAFRGRAGWEVSPSGGGSFHDGRLPFPVFLPS